LFVVPDHELYIFLYTSNMQLKPVTVEAEYKDEAVEYTVWASDLWESWALQLLKDPVYIHKMHWDAIRTFRHNGRAWERFFTEPWTADAWWEVQVSVVDFPESAIADRSFATLS
jgi:Plavaka transposase